MIQGSNPCPCIGRWTLNHWTTREAQKPINFCIKNKTEMLQKPMETAVGHTGRHHPGHGGALCCITVKNLVSSVQSLSHVRLYNPMDCSMPGFPVHHQLLELVQTHVHHVSDAIQPSHPLSSPSPPAFNLSQHQGLFQWVSSSHQVAKYWSFSFSSSPSNEYSGLISFRMD